MALLDPGASLPSRDELAGTPLHHALLGHRSGDVPQAVRLPIDVGAGLDARDASGATVRGLAVCRRDAVALRASAEAGRKPNKKSFEANPAVRYGPTARGPCF